MTIVVPAGAAMATVVERLAAIGYRHRGDLGVPGREAFGRPILSRQGVSFKLADMAMLVEAARLLVWRAAAADDSGLLGSYAKAFAADAAMQITTDAVQVLGGAGIMRDHPVEKWMRDAKVFQIVEGTSEIQRHIVSMYLKDDI